MTIDRNAAVTAAEAGRDFPAVAKLAEEKGHVLILDGGRPKLLLIDLDTEPQLEMTEDEKMEFAASRILREHRAAFEELAR